MNKTLDDFKSERETIQGFVDKGNYHAAYNIALSALNACRKNNNQSGVDGFLGVITGIVETMTNEFGSKSY